MSRCWQALGVATAIGVCVVSSACRVATVPSLPPLGLEVPVERGRVGVSGGMVRLAAVSPVVVLAWTATGVGDGSVVHAAVSRDNGASFEIPVAVGEVDAADGGQRPGLQVSVVGPSAVVATGGRTTFQIAWRRAGAEVERHLHVTSSAVTLDAERRRVDDAHPDPVVCGTGGGLFFEPPRGAADVQAPEPVLVGSACRGEVVAVQDARGRAHMVWVRHTTDDMVVFSTSDGRQAFDSTPVSEAGAIGPVRAVLDNNGTVVSVWRTGSGTRGSVHLRQVLPHRGYTQLMTPLQLSPEATGEGLDIAAIDGGVLVAWAEPRGSDVAIVTARVGLDAICFDSGMTGA